MTLIQSDILNFQENSIPQFEFIEVTTTTPVMFERPVRYDVTILTTPRTVIPYDIGVTVLGNHTLGVCRVAVKSYGRNVPCSKYGVRHEFSAMNWQDDGGLMNDHYYDRALLDLENIANIGQ